jgi:outer membrane protein assembly factor BamB
VLVALCTLSLKWWITDTPKQDISERLPVPIPPEQLALSRVDIKGQFKSFDGTPSNIRSEWPTFRGANYDNISHETITLADAWGANGPSEIWAIDVGEGYAGPAVANGRVYLLDYDEAEGADSLRCFSFDDGKELWRRWYKVKIKRNHGMSRTVPAVNDKYVVTMGPKCQVMCADAITGDFLWGIDLPVDYETEVPLWYTGQCPIIDGNTAVIATGGKALLIGVDLASGEIVWETPNPETYQMSHSSIIPMTLCGKKMYVYCAIGATVGISAETNDLGKLLWETSAWNHTVIAPAPVALPDDRILVTTGYGAGSMILQLSRSGDIFSAEPLKTIPRSQFACEQHTPILYNDHLITVLPGDGGALKKQAVCMDLDGSLVWNSGKMNRFGIGPFIIADDKLFILSDDGELTMAEAGISEYKELAQHQVLDGHDAWGPIAIAQGRMLLRDFNRMICIDLRGNKE